MDSSQLNPPKNPVHGRIRRKRSAPFFRCSNNDIFKKLKCTVYVELKHKVKILKCPFSPSSI